MAMEPDQDPDVIIYYCHGGGFSMGSSYFYIEFLMAWLSCLKDKGYRNPACFALEYTLVPDATWPVQFEETRAAFKFLRDGFGEGSAERICVSGDSAGATLMLSLLLHPVATDQDPPLEERDVPGLAILLSPWTHLVSELNQNTPSDYLNSESLHLYASQYAGNLTRTDKVVSPGLSVGRWQQASPVDGYRVIYGAEEVFAPGILEMCKSMKKDGVVIQRHAEPAGIHAWPVVNLFLGESREARLHGLQKMTDYVASSKIKPPKS